MKHARLFVGTFLQEPQCESIEVLKSFDENLAEFWGQRLRWVHRDKLHLTWCFIGEVGESSIGSIVSSLDSVFALARNPIELSYCTPEIWPNARRPKQLVLSDRINGIEVQTLARAVNIAALPFLNRAETHEFVPHITLLRFKESGKRTGRSLVLPDWWPVHDILPMVQPIGECSLIRSYTNKVGKDAYERIHTWQLPG